MELTDSSLMFDSIYLSQASNFDVHIRRVAGLRTRDYESFQRLPRRQARSTWYIEVNPQMEHIKSLAVWSLHKVPIECFPKLTRSILPWPLPPASLRIGIEMRLALKPSSISSKMPSPQPSEQPPSWVVSACSYHQYRTHSRSKTSQHGAWSRALAAQRRPLVILKITRGWSGEANWL